MINRNHRHKGPSKALRMAHPSILIVGEDPAVTEVAAALNRLNAKLITEQWSKDVPTTVGDAITAIVLVSPLGTTSIARAIGAIRGHPAGREIPLFVVLSKTTSTGEIRRLYSHGPSAVFEWPTESEVLPFCLAEMIAANFVRGPVSHPDSALARATRAQIRTRCDFNHSVRVQVRDAVALLSGSVDQLVQKHRIKEVAISVPGLKGVIDRDVFVLPSGIPDDAINDRINRMLRDVSDIDDKTLAIRVENGYVTLAGSVGRRAEVKRLARMVSNIRGVRDVKLRMVVSPSQNRQDHRIAKRLQTMLRQLFIGEDVNVTFFGNTAVLSGKVTSLYTKMRMAELLDDQDVVDRIVNKLDVTQEKGE